MRKKKKNVSKRKSIILFSCLTAILAVLLLFTFCPFSFGDESVMEYKSVVGAINKGIDINGGFYAVLEPIAPDLGTAEREKYDRNFDDNVKSTINTIQNRITAKGYIGAAVAKQESTDGTVGIRIEIPKVDKADDFFKFLGKSAVFEIRSESDEVLVEGADISSTQVVYYNGSYIVIVKFNSNGTAALKKATEDNFNKTMGIFIDDDSIGAPNITEVISDGRITISAGSTSQSADELSIQLKSGALPLKLNTVTFESREVSPTLGENSLMLCLIACIIGVCLIVIFMFVFYKGFGIAANLALIFYAVVLLFLLSQLPWVQLSLAGIIGIIFSIGIAVNANIIILERIKDEYASGKSLLAAVDAGFKRAMVTIIDTGIILVIASIFLWVLGPVAMQSFAIVLLTGVILSLIFSLVISRFLIKRTLPLSKSEKFFGLKREEGTENV